MQFQHNADVPAANKMIELLARRAFPLISAATTTLPEPKTLSRYVAIIMNSTAHLTIPDQGKRAALLDYRKGGGVVEIRAAIHTFKDWLAAAEAIGGMFAGQPFIGTGNWGVKIESPGDPLTVFEGKDS